MTDAAPEHDERSVHRLRIDCVVTAGTRVTHVGGRSPDGLRWRLTLDDAISGIEAGRWTMYCLAEAGRTVEVVTQARNRRSALVGSDRGRIVSLKRLRRCDQAASRAGGE